MLRRTLTAIAAATLFTIAAAVPASAGYFDYPVPKYPAPWAGCAVGAFTSSSVVPPATVSLSITIQPCSWSNPGKWGVIFYTQIAGNAAITTYPQPPGEVAMRATFTSVDRAFCLAGGVQNRIDCRSVTWAPDGSVVLAPLATNDPWLASLPVTYTDIGPDPHCLTCV